MKKLLSLFLLFISITTLSSAQDKISKGTAIKILEIGKADAYYEERVDFLGTDATALGDLTKKPDGFYSGTIETKTGRTCFFTEVKVSKVASSTTKTTTASKSTESGFPASSTISKGTKFKVIEVPSDDAYYSDKDEIEGQTGTTKDELLIDSDGYTSGSIDLDNGENYYFYKVKLGKASGTSSTVTTTSKTPKFITGIIKSGTSVYLAEIASDDSYYSDRFERVGMKGKIGKSDLTMKEDGWYAGDFTYSDGSTAYFYKAKFSKEPIDKLVKTGSETDTKTNSNDDDYWDAFLDTPVKTSDDTKDWSSARNDDDIKEGDKVEITAVSPEDSYYEDKDEYVGQKGVAGDDIEFISEDEGYGGTVKLDNGESPYFYLIKLKKAGSSSNSTKTTTKSSSSSNLPSTIAKNTKVRVIDLGEEDSFYSSKSKYVRKTGKVADGLNLQDGGYYSGKILFDDGTDAYFFNVKVTVL